MEHLDTIILNLVSNLPALLWVTLVSLVQWFIPRTWYAKDVSNEVVLITGAGGGLGREIALEYARLNASLVLWDINKEGLEETKRLIDHEHARLLSPKDDKFQYEETRFCLSYVVDVSDKDKVYKAAMKVQDDLDALQRQEGLESKYVSVLVNNAGIYYGLMFQELKDDQIERIFKINILAHFWTVRAFLPEMIKREHGHIVEIASMGGISGLYKQVDYCATKFATIGFEESLSIELQAMGLGEKVHTTAVCPLFFQSNLFTGYDSTKAPIMTCEHVAREAVMGMRCNDSKVLLPSSAHLLNIMRPLTPRRGILLWARILNLTNGIRNIKGAAAVAH